MRDEMMTNEHARILYDLKKNETTCSSVTNAWTSFTTASNMFGNAANAIWNLVMQANWGSISIATMAWWKPHQLSARTSQAASSPTVTFDLGRESYKMQPIHAMRHILGRANKGTIYDGARKLKQGGGSNVRLEEPENDSTIIIKS